MGSEVGVRGEGREREQTGEGARAREKASQRVEAGANRAQGALAAERPRVRG